MTRLRNIGRRILGLDVAPDHTVALLHTTEPAAPPLGARELLQLRHIRLFGATGTVMMAIAALGVGAQPVPVNPTWGVRILSLPSRAQTSAITMAMTGTVMVILAWLLLSRFAIGRSHGRMTRSQLDRTLLLWVTPLAVGPPMFSQDVYSYLAQSKIAGIGLNPYEFGPGPALGVNNVLTRSVPSIWRDTPAPYGPSFLWAGEGIYKITGDNIIASIWLHRLLALGGVALIVWALPRLAERCGVSPVAALWLGALNPLVLFHLVSGLHNDALMIGVMLAGFEIALRGLDSTRAFDARAWGLLLAGASLIALSSTIKVISVIALGFVGMALARRWGGSVRALFGAAALLTTILVAIVVVSSLASGLGFAWLDPTVLGPATTVRSWMSIPTLLGVITGFGGVLLGLGDHTTALLALTRPIALVVAGAIMLRMLVATYTGRLHPVGALGVSFGALVLLFPVVQPWYLLWAVTPLAAWATRRAFRYPTIGFSAVVSVFLMPNGSEFRPFQIVQASVATVLICAALILMTRNLLPWGRDSGAPEPEPQRGAYAGSS